MTTADLPLPAIIDGSNVLMRYAHAMLGAADVPVEAHMGRIIMAAFRRVSDWAAEQGVTHLIVAWDGPPGTLSFRHRRFPEHYKVSDTPPDPRYDRGRWCEAAAKVLDLWGWMHVSAAGFEGDDVVATLVRRLNTTGAFRSPLVLSNDADLLTLLTAARVFHFYKQTIVERDDQYVRDRYGVRARQLTDFKAMVGEEGLPGAPRIGVKKAATILGMLDTLEDAVTGLAVPRLASDGETPILEVRDCIRLRDDVPLPALTSGACRFSPFTPSTARP